MTSEIVNELVSLDEKVVQDKICLDFDIDFYPSQLIGLRQS